MACILAGKELSSVCRSEVTACFSAASLAIFMPARCFSRGAQRDGNHCAPHCHCSWEVSVRLACSPDLALFFFVLDFQVTWSVESFFISCRVVNSTLELIKKLSTRMTLWLCVFGVHFQTSLLSSVSSSSTMMIALPRGWRHWRQQLRTEWHDTVARTCIPAEMMIVIQGRYSSNCGFNFQPLLRLACLRFSVVFHSHSSQ